MKYRIKFTESKQKTEIKNDSLEDDLSTCV